MKKIWFLSIILASYFGFSQVVKEPITDYSGKELKNGILLDVRTPEEFQEGHLDRALNINWYDSDFAEQIQRLDKEKTIYVYCKLGGRSAKASKVLDSLGFKNVVDLTGGYDTFKTAKEKRE
ncbi:rhodanese-like domain-containing protein [Flavobacteriaceae bacterium F89]|uniref:Rhodanese-like domain-containing protein n=1 Tax=Cerina litoralis TaxID=2874477 RepID=A0AAE3EVK1_9FLAO|nr:rhodanese-like domain-containing protein [Cerina litoralis]MCG2461738.1 rhodanese-like domain-containing protein [Cerina litoralis]